MIRGFLKYVEITTKITSLFAFLMSLACLYCWKQDINWELTLLFFAGMFFFDLVTTAINNYIDTKTNDQVLTLPRKTALAVIVVLLLLSSGCGIWLACQTDLVVLLCGGLCFLGGIFYTWGPVPISRLPLGEVFSGVFYGLAIPFILLYINMPKGTFLNLELTGETISFSLQIMPVIVLLLIAVPAVCTTANIMLANNICDVDKDVLVKRYTLPFYLGRKTSLRLFAGTYYVIYPAWLALIIIKVFPPVCLLFFITLIPVQKNIRIFQRKQDKGVTFFCSIKNYVILMGADAGLIFICGLGF